MKKLTQCQNKKKSIKSVNNVPLEVQSDMKVTTFVQGFSQFKCFTEKKMLLNL